MKVMEGLGRIRKFWPDVMFRMLGERRLDVMHRRLDLLAQGPEPETLKDLIRRMDGAGLGIQGKFVVLSD